MLVQVIDKLENIAFHCTGDGDVVYQATHEAVRCVE